MARGGYRPGAGRPRTLDHQIKKSFVLDDASNAALLRLAETLGVSESQALRRLLLGLAVTEAEDTTPKA